jgi:hypothetical protein
MTRRQVFDLVAQPDRETELFVFSHGGTVASYTLDRDYITPLEIVGTTDLRKILPLGHVLAFNPVTKKVVPYFTTYGFEPVGVLLHDADAHSSDPAVPVIWRGDLLETSCWDNGTYRAVLQSTKDTLTDRIAFVKETGLVSFP